MLHQRRGVNFVSVQGLNPDTVFYWNEPQMPNKYVRQGSNVEDSSSLGSLRPIHQPPEILTQFRDWTSNLKYKMHVPHKWPMAHATLTP